MTKQEEEVGTELARLVVGAVAALPPGHTLAGVRCEVFADADGNIWAKDAEGRLVGRVQLFLAACPT